jgi:hypothetical protein
MGDSLTEELLAHALEDIRKQRHGKDEWPPKPEQLSSAYFYSWMCYRNGAIEKWAHQYRDVYGEEPLARRCDCLLDMLAEYGEYWEDPDPKNEAETAAWALACLRWLRMERLGTAPPSQVDHDTLIDFIAQECDFQLPLL